MLVLARRVGQQIRIADEVEIKILDVVGKKVRLGISAPCDVPIHREEIYQRLERDSSVGDPLKSVLSGSDTVCELDLIAAT
jgi:carbon storage regulator